MKTMMTFFQDGTMTIEMWKFKQLTNMRTKCLLALLAITNGSIKIGVYSVSRFQLPLEL